MLVGLLGRLSINALAKLVKKEGWCTIEYFTDCVNSEEVKDNLKKMYKKTIKPLNIHQTPHVFVNKMPTAANKSIFYLIDKEYKKLKNN